MIDVLMFLVIAGGGVGFFILIYRWMRSQD